MRSQPGRLVAALVGLSLFASIARAADAGADVAESMKKLAALKYYKVRNSIDFHLPPELQRQMDALKSSGIGDITPRPTVTEFVNPDLRRSTTTQRMPAMSRKVGAPPMLDATVITVVRAPSGAAPKVATFMGCPQCEQGQDEAMNDMLSQQAAATAKGIVSEVIGGLLGGPIGIAGAVLSAARTGAEAGMMRAAGEKLKQNLSLNRWTCHDLGLPAQPASGEAGGLPSFQSAELLGERMVGEETTKAYQVSTAAPGTDKASPMVVYVSTRTGLPLKIEMAMEMGAGMSGGMTMEYYDFDVPVQIEVPECLK